MPKRTASATWKATRARVLEAYPTCHWCGVNPSTEADHLLEHDAGGDDSEANLVGACRTCNGRRGQAYQARRDAARIAAREHAAQPLYGAKPLPPTPCNSLSHSEQPELAPTGPAQPDPEPTGRALPRLESARHGGHSWGPEVATWARHNLGLELMPWQVHCLTGQLEYVTDPGAPWGWRLVNREALTSTARQCGKSLALQALIGWWLTELPTITGTPLAVLSTANALDRAEAIFSNLAPRLIERHGGRALNAIGRKTLRLDNGSTWDVRAATPRLHGGSYSLIVVDELWNVSAATVDEALRPSQIAQPSPLLSMWSTAGDQGSTAMIDYRERAIAALDTGTPSSNYFAEWSLPPGVSPTDRRYWGWANPALGTTITMRALEAAANKDGFVRAHLNQWVTARGAWLEPGTWEGLSVNLEVPTGGVLAVDSSLDEGRYVGVIAGLVDNRTVVDLAFAVDTETAMWAEVAQIMGDDRTLTLAVTPGLATHLPTQYNRRFEQVGYAELIRHTAVVRNMITEGRVVHRGSQVLAEHVTRAVSTKAQNGLVLSSQKSPGPIEAARCMVWAVGMASRARNRERPLVVVAR